MTWALKLAQSGKNVDAFVIKIRFFPSIPLMLPTVLMSHSKPSMVFGTRSIYQGAHTIFEAGGWVGLREW